MGDNKILLIGGSFLIKGYIKGISILMKEISEKLEHFLHNKNFLEKAPFKTISLIIRFGNETNLNVEYGCINKRYSELPVSVLLDLKHMKSLEQDNLKIALFRTVLVVIKDVSQKYNLELYEKELDCQLLYFETTSNL